MKAQKPIDAARTLVAGDKCLLGGVMGGTASSVSSSQMQPSCPPRRIQCRDGKGMSMASGIPQLTKPAGSVLILCCREKLGDTFRHCFVLRGGIIFSHPAA